MKVEALDFELWTAFPQAVSGSDSQERLIIIISVVGLSRRVSRVSSRREQKERKALESRSSLPPSIFRIGFHNLPLSRHLLLLLQDPGFVAFPN